MIGMSRDPSKKRKDIMEEEKKQFEWKGLQV